MADPASDPASHPAPDDGGAEADQQALRKAKRTLRRAVQLRRRARSEDARRLDDQDRFGLLQNDITRLRPACVASYLSSAPEPDTLRLVGWLAATGVEVLLPLLSSTEDGSISAPDWARYAGPDALVTGPCGIVQPTSGALGATGLAAAEFIVLPGLAGTRAGERLGRGGGWYDRALGSAAPQAQTVLLLNDDEVLEVLPAQPWDRRVDRIVTPRLALDCADAV